MPDNRLNRRRFIYRTGAAVAATAGVPLLEACSPNGEPGSDSTPPASSRSGSSATPARPTYVAFDKVTADLPALDNGAPSGFLAYPEDPPKLYDRAPGKGGSISILQEVLNAVAPAMGRNAFWQELNERVGTDLKFSQYDGGANYGPKFATTIAGGELPDVMTMVVSAHFAELLASKFQDLSTWLSGDAIKQFPSLTAIQPPAWANMVFNHGIYGLPYAWSAVSSVMTVRDDILRERGLTTQLSSGQDFLDMCKSLTDPKRGRWAITDPLYSALPFVMEMVEAPNGWKEEGGRFTNTYETDEYKRGLDILHKMWQEQYIEPDALSAGTSAFQGWFSTGRAAIAHINYTTWPAWLQSSTEQSSTASIDGLVAPKWDGGGQAGHHLGPGYFQFIALKKAPAGRIEEILRVLDYLAAPFGTEEYMFVRYGLTGRDFSLKGTDPIETPTGISEAQNLNAGLLACGDDPIYVPGRQDITKACYKVVGQLMDVTVPLPTNGLYSETNIGVGATINKAVNDLRTDIILGRKPLSAWDAAITTWRSGGGDTIRREYEEAFADAH